MSTEFRDKLRSLHFSVRAPTHKRTLEGDQNEGRIVTESDERHDVQVFIPPIQIQMDLPMVGELKEQAADAKADAARKEADA